MQTAEKRILHLLQQSPSCCGDSRGTEKYLVRWGSW